MNSVTHTVHGSIITNCAEQSSPLQIKFSSTNFRVNIFIEIVKTIALTYSFSAKINSEFSKIESNEDLSKVSRLFLIFINLANFQIVKFHKVN